MADFNRAETEGRDVGPRDGTTLYRVRRLGRQRPDYRAGGPGPPPAGPPAPVVAAASPAQPNLQG